MIKHICPFCNSELSFDSEGILNYYTCNVESCKLGTFSRCEFNYINDEMTFRSLIVELDSTYYRVESSYLANFMYIERLERILSKSIPNAINYLSISVFKIEQFVIKQNDSLEDILKTVKRFLNLRAFL